MCSIKRLRESRTIFTQPYDKTTEILYEGKHERLAQHREICVPFFCVRALESACNNSSVGNSEEISHGDKVCVAALSMVIEGGDGRTAPSPFLKLSSARGMAREM